MSYLFIFSTLLLLSTVGAVPIAGAISGSNGTLPFGKGIRPISFPNLSWYPGSTITIQEDYISFYVSTAGPIFLSINADVSAKGCGDFTYVGLYRLDTRSDIRRWSVMASGGLSEITTFFAPENTMYHFQLETCHGGKSSIANTSVSWFQPAATAN